MAHITSRKHSAPVQPRLTTTAAALAALTIPMAVHAQDAAAPAPAASAPAAAASAPAAVSAASAAAPPAAPQQMPEVRVQSSRQAPFKADAVASPKFTQPLVDTPQTITVIRRELMQQRSATTLTEALRNSPGITLLLGENGNTQTGDAVVMRGFDTSASIFVDNIRDLGAITRDMFNIEQVEVVKGPSGADNGRGASSGYINLVSKAPSLKDGTGGSVVLGEEGRLRATADLNRRFDLGLPGTAFRLNFVTDEGGVPGRDEVENKMFAVAPSLSIGLGTPTRATFYYLHSETRNVPDGGVPTIGLPGFFDAIFAPGNPLAGVVPAAPDRSNFYGARDDHNNVDVDMLTVKIEHDFAPGTVLTNTSRLAHSAQDYLIGAISGTNPTDATSCNRGWFSVCVPGTSTVSTDPSVWTVLRNRQASVRTNDIITNQTNLATEFQAAGIKHNFTGGVEVIYEQQRSSTLTAPAGSNTPANLYDPNIDDAFPTVVAGSNGAFTDGSTLTAALYGFDTLTLNEKVKLNAGLRLEKFRTQTDSAAVVSNVLTPGSLSVGDQLLSWKVGGIYKPEPNGTYYVSMANAKFPPGSATFALSANANNAANPIRKPQEGSNIEVGTKWDLYDNRLAFAAALYRSENSNEVIADPTDPTVFIQVGERRIQGIELSASGQITPAWDVNVGLGWMNAEITQGTIGPDGTQGGLLQWTPEWSFTAWSSYQLPSGWRLGGGAQYIDTVVRSSTNFSVPPVGLVGTEPYWVFDAMAAYAVNRNVTIQFNVFNLLDEEYVGSLNNSGKRYIPGAPRHLQVSAVFTY